MSSCTDFWANSSALWSASRRRRWRHQAANELAVVAFGLALTLQLTGRAAAALIECPRIAATSGSKVVVDEVRPSEGGAATLSALEERRLQNAIHQQIGQLNAERPAQVQAVVCRQRWPEGPDEFSPALSRNLLAHDVLIELWGESEADLALIQYAILPVRLRAASNLPGIYSSAYPFDIAGGIDSLFRDARELQAFTALALGFQAFEQARAASTVNDADKIARSARFNDARSYFCEAERLLSEARAMADEFGPDSQQWKALIALATQGAAETARTARADPAYIGALKLLPDSLLDSCQPGVS
jgi:hypothetical protein